MGVIEKKKKRSNKVVLKRKMVHSMGKINDGQSMGIIFISKLIENTGHK